MFVLIDSTNARAIAKHAHYKAMAALAYIQFANVDTVVVPLDENKGFAQFEHSELVSIGAALGVKIPKPGSAYGDAIKSLRAAILACDLLDFPFTEFQVSYQADAIHPDCDLPRAFNPAEGIHPAAFPGKWAVEPQRNRKRKDSTYGTMFGAVTKNAPSASSGIITLVNTPGRSVGARDDVPVAAPKPPAHSQARKPGVPKPTQPAGATPVAAPARVKRVAAPSAPGARPASGTSTGKVWDIADKVFATGVRDKELRQQVIVACTKDGLNSSTASVQFGKWKGSRGI